MHTRRHLPSFRRLSPLFLALAWATLSSVSCSIGTVSTPPNGVVSIAGGRYQLHLPPGFVRNGSTRYPLLISLHGGTSSTDAFMAPSFVYDPDAYASHQALVFAPNSVSGYGSSAAGWIHDEIARMLRERDYRIDPNRVYAVGYSMGGFGCTNFARDLWLEHGIRLAAIVPIGGGNWPDLPEPEIREGTAAWFHYGADGDYSQESDWDAAFEYFAGAPTETSRFTDRLRQWDGTLRSFSVTTRSLCIDNRLAFRLSVWGGMGHEADPVLRSPEVLTWLFEQSLD